MFNHVNCYEMALGRARILSSENDANVKQEQNTNVEIQIKPPVNSNLPVNPQLSQRMSQPIPQQIPTRSDQSLNNYFEEPLSSQIPQRSSQQFTQQPIDRVNCAPHINFTIPQQNAQLESPQATNVIQDRGISDLTNDLDTLEERNKMLELLLSIYEDNPLHINNVIVCTSTALMDLIKKLTNSDKVELMINEDANCSGCIHNTKYLNIEKILITKDGHSTEFKHSFNNIYTELIRHNISLKLCI